MITIAKLILFSSSIKNGTHAANFVQYIATREGVEFNATEFMGENTKKQQDLIANILENYSFLKQLEEYGQYQNDKSKAKASIFLTEAFHLIEDQSASKDYYLKYISERPRVEKIKTHGLFNSSGEANLDLEIKNIREHPGVIWTHIVSLKREDAKRLGYDNLEQWQLLLTTKMQKVADSMNIQLKNLVWNAAFHNEGHHPHIHIAMYSKDTKQGFLDKQGIKKIKSVFMNEIYKEELNILKEEKTLVRDEIKAEFGSEIDKIYEKIITKNFNVNSELINQFIELSKNIPSSGKNVYGYQNKEVKQQVDKIVGAIVKNKNIKELFDVYENYHKEMAGFYSSKEYKEEEIVKNKDFRPLQNKILKVASEISKNIKIDDDIKIAQIDNDGSDYSNITISETVEERLKKIDEELKKIEETFKTESQSIAESDPVEILPLGEEELLEQKTKSLKCIQDMFFEYYKDNNGLLGKLLEKDAAVLEVMGELETVLDNEDFKEYFEDYKFACLEYSKLNNLNGEDEIYKGLETMAKNVIGLSDEVEQLQVNVEGNYMMLKSNCFNLIETYGKSNMPFRKILSMLAELMENKEDYYVDKFVNKAVEMIFNDDDIKKDYETFILSCEKYCNVINSNYDEKIGAAFEPIKREILNISSSKDFEKYDNKITLSNLPQVTKDKILNKLDNKMKEIENFQKEKDNNNVSELDYKENKKQNYYEEEKEIVKQMNDSLSSIEDNILNKLDYYNNVPEFRKFVKDIISFKNGEMVQQFNNEKKLVQWYVTKAVDVMLKDEDFKSDYEDYKNACDDYSILTKSKASEEIERGLKDLYNEVINYINSNIETYYKDTKIELENSKSKLETTFLNVLEEYNKVPSFTFLLNSIVRDNKNYLYDKTFMGINKGVIDKSLEKVVNTIFKDEAIREDYKRFLLVCEDFSNLHNYDKTEVIEENLKDFKYEILNLAYENKGKRAVGLNDYIKDLHYEDKLKDKIVSGARKIKKDYMLNPNLNVRYQDYKLQDQEVIKYIVKSIVFDIVDMFYFSAKEEEYKNKKRLGENNNINRNKRMQKNEHSISQ